MQYLSDILSNSSLSFRWLKYVSGVGRQNVEKNVLVTAEVDADQVDMIGVSIEHEHDASGRWY